MSSITYLRNDSNFDPSFDSTASLTDLQAVQQAILTTILLFQGEWWENLNSGTPMFQQILGTRATPNQQQIMSQILASRINSVPYVTAVQDINIGFNPTTRKLSFSATAQTTFGPVVVSFGPGSVASLFG